MKKLVNVRPLVAIALSQIFGIFLAAFLPSLGIWARLVPLIVVTIICGMALLFSVGGVKRVFNFAVACLCIAFTYLGGLAVNNRAESLSGNFKDGEYLVNGVVDYVSWNENGYNVRLTDCSIDGKKCGNIAINGIRLCVDRYDAISAQCSLTAAETVSGGKFTSYVYYDVRLVAKDCSDVKINGVKECLPYKFRKFVAEKLRNSDEEIQAIAFALTCGDTARMKDKIDIFRATGIAHVFAVSGLHIGLLCVMLSLLFRPFPINKTIKSLITACVLVLYSYCCGFSASSVRAAIMCSIYLLTSAAYEKKDRLSALAASSIVVLAINPFDLFGAGYVLSFTLSLSLIAIAPAVTAALPGNSESLKSTISTLVSAESVAVPLSVKYFGAFPLSSVIGNLVIVPCVTAAFYSLVIGLVLSLVIPSAAAMYVADAILVGTVSFTDFISKINLSVTFFPDYLRAVYFLTLAVSSDLVNVGGKVKRFCVFLAIVILLSALFVGYSS